MESRLRPKRGLPREIYRKISSLESVTRIKYCNFLFVIGENDCVYTPFVRPTWTSKVQLSSAHKPTQLPHMMKYTHPLTAFLLSIPILISTLIVPMLERTLPTHTQMPHLSQPSTLCPNHPQQQQPAPSQASASASPPSMQAISSTPPSSDSAKARECPLMAGMKI